MQKPHYLIPILILFYLPVVLFGQTNDAGLWLGASVEKKISKEFKLSITEELRFKENISTIDKNNIDIGASYSPLKWISLGLFYRAIFTKEIEGWWTNSHRYYSDILLKYESLHFKYSIRSRYQTQHGGIEESRDWDILEHYIRNKVAVSYGILNNPLEFKIAVETFTPLISSIDFFDKLRFSTAVEYTISKKQSVEAIYLIQKELNVANPISSYIIGIGYNYKFK